MIWQHSANAWRGVRAAGRWLAGDGGHSQNCALYMGSGRGWLAGRWLAVNGGVLNITAVGFHWWRSGNITRMQNVSEYMLVLALCLVLCCQYQCDWLLGKTVPEMTYYVSRGTLCNCCLAHSACRFACPTTQILRRKCSLIKWNTWKC